MNKVINKSTTAAAVILLSTLAVAGSKMPMPETLAATVAEDTVLENLSYIRSHRLGACSYWNYDSSSRGYVCSSYPSSVEVADAYSVEQENQALKDKISELERRIKALEERQP